MAKCSGAGISDNGTYNPGQSPGAPPEAAAVCDPSDASPVTRPPLPSDNPVLPPLDEKFIKIEALSGSADGEERVAQHAAATITKCFGGQLAEARGAQQDSKERIAGYQRKIELYSATRNGQDPYVDVVRHSQPWTTFDTVQLWILALVSLIVLAVGLNTMAVMLGESGRRSFENPLVRYFFSFLPTAMPFALKLLESEIESQLGRKVYRVILWLFALFFGFLWTILVSHAFSGGASTAESLARAISLNATTTGQDDYAQWFLCIGSFAEGLFAASLWLSIQRLVEKHQSSQRVPNPLYEETQKAINHWTAMANEEKSYERKAAGRVTQLENAIQTYVGQSVNAYRGIVAAKGTREELAAVLQATTEQPSSGRKFWRAAAVLVIALLSSTSGNGADIIFGLAPDYEARDKELVFQGVVQFALEGGNPGDTIQIFDALNLKPITKLQIPVGETFRYNARARLTRMQSEIAALKTFFTAQRTTASNMLGVIDVPGFLWLVATHVRKPGEAITVVLIGSPHYMDPDGNFSTVDSFPSDAHLAAADSRETPFSVANRKDALAGVTVHYAFLHDSFVNDYHKERLGRFASLFVAEQKGVLSSYAADLAIVLRRLKDGVRQAFMTATLDPNDDKVEMRRVTPRTIPTWFPPTNVIKLVAAPNPPAAIITPITVASPEPVVPASAPGEAPEFAAAKPPAIVVRPSAPAPVIDPLPIPQPVNSGIGIGIMWKIDGCDLDLHVQSGPGAKELSYKRHSTPEGHYFHDFKDRNDSLDFEYVELAPGTSDISTIKAFVNFYRGRASQVKGVVIVRYGGHSYFGDFAIQATEGNHGRDIDRRKLSPYWTELDIAGIVKAGRQNLK